MKLLILLVLCSWCSAFIGSDQKVRVDGQIYCLYPLDNNTTVEDVLGIVEKAANAHVTLLEADYDLDDRLSETVADANGTFLISGHQSEVVWISPYLKLEHNCGGPDNTGPMEKRCHFVEYTAPLAQKKLESEHRLDFFINTATAEIKCD